MALAVPVPAAKVAFGLHINELREEGQQHEVASFCWVLGGSSCLFPIRAEPGIPLDHVLEP